MLKDVVLLDGVTQDLALRQCCIVGSGPLCCFRSNRPVTDLGPDPTKNDLK